MPTAASRGNQAASTRHRERDRGGDGALHVLEPRSSDGLGGIGRSGEHLQRVPERRRPPELAGRLRAGSVLEQQSSADAPRDPPGVHRDARTHVFDDLGHEVRQALFAAAPDSARLSLSSGQDLGCRHICSAQAGFQSVSALLVRARVPFGCERCRLLTDLVQPLGCHALGAFAERLCLALQRIQGGEDGGELDGRLVADASRYSRGAPEALEEAADRPDRALPGNCRPRCLRHPSTICRPCVTRLGARLDPNSDTYGPW